MKTTWIFIFSLLSLGSPMANGDENSNIQINKEPEILVQGESIDKASLSRHAQNSRSATVKIMTGHGHGSGTYIKIGDTFGVITAAHVVNDGNK